VPLLQLFHVEQLCALRCKHSAWVTEAEAVTLTGLVTHVTSVEVAFHRSCDRASLEVLEAIWHVGLNKSSISVRQEVVHCIALRQHAHVPDCVDVVVSRTYSSGSFQKTIRHKLKLWRND